MATLQITIPNGEPLTTMVAVATADLQSRGISTGGLTSTQIGQRYIAEFLKREYIKAKKDASLPAVMAAIDVAEASAKTTAEGIA